MQLPRTTEKPFIVQYTEVNKGPWIEDDPAFGTVEAARAHADKLLRGERKRHAVRVLKVEYYDAQPL